MQFSNRTRLALICLCMSCLPLAPAAQTQEKSNWKSGFVQAADGAKIHYLEAGHVTTTGSSHIGGTPPPGAMSKGKVAISSIPQQPAILLVPGWTMPAWIWEKQIEHFSTNYRVVAMDPRAQGESSQASEGLYPAARARDIREVVKQLHLEPVVLIGWSMGVTELCAFVDQFGTAGVVGFVLVDGVPGFDLPPERFKDVIAFFASFQKDRHKATEAFVRSMYKKPQTEEYLQRVIKASLVTPTNSAVALSLGAMGSDYWGVLPKINRPALIVATQSPFIAAYQRIQREVPGARMEVFEDAGHALFVDDADRFNSLLGEFLKTLR